MRCHLVFFVSSVFWSFVFSESCTTPIGEESQCVPLPNCPPLLAAFEARPLPSHVVSFLRQSQCGFEGYLPTVCCGPLPSNLKPATTPRPQTVRPPTNVGRIDPVSQEDSEPSRHGKCGIDTNGDRIFGGEITELDEFPWMALLGYRTPSRNLSFKCGGVLINRRYILTAAHCVVGAIETDVGILEIARLGEYDMQTDVDCVDDTCAEPVQDIPVMGKYPNPGFVDGTKNRKDDIAVLRLAHRAKLSYYVQPICLTDSNLRIDVGNTVYVAGWGQTLESKNSPIKLKLGVPLFDKKDCNSKYKTLGADLTDKQLCAGGVFAQDACRGDSGGPLMRKLPSGEWEAVAVVSFGYGCGRDGWPGVYTSVASYRSWIDQTLRSSNV